MAHFNQQGMNGGMIPVQYPYTNNLIMNTPYDNYLGRNNVTVNANSQNNYPNQFLKCRPVASKEQARAAQIDLDGSLWVFTDVGNQKIYTKQINYDGTATFKTYALTADENPYNSSEYVTKDEFNSVIQNLMAAIQSQTTTQKAQTESVQNNKNTEQSSNSNFIVKRV